MKICPTCRRTYDDDALNFCLDDGSVLTFGVDHSNAPTIAMNPRPTAPGHPSQGMQQGWTPPAATPYSMQPKKKKSRGWLWAVAILCLGILLCGGSIAGMFVYFASVANNNTRVANNSTNARWTNSTNPNANSSPVDPSRVEEIGLEDWSKQTSSWGTNEFKDGELFMASKEKGNYFVIVATDQYKTDKAATRVTVRNAENVESGLGYGLVIHSDSTPLQNDYAFLIDAKRKRFRIVRHDPEKEVAVVPWTNSKLINEGTADNVIEARDKGAKIELYLNGQLATSITNKQGPTGGVPGLYTGDGAKIAFKKLEIIK